LRCAQEGHFNRWNEEPEMPDRLARLLQITPVRLVVLLVGFFALDAVVGGPLSKLAETTNPFRALLTLVLGLAAAVASVRIYRWVIGRVEHRPATEFDPAPARSGLIRGSLVGIGIFTVVMLLIAVFGGYDSFGYGSFWSLLATLGLMAAVAVLEEIVFRATLFRLLEQMTGTTGAMIGSALVFGALHLLTPNATPWGALAIAIQGGLMMAACYAVTRSLWLPIGLHFGWNFAEGGIFGTAVSGNNSTNTGLFSSHLGGPLLISGGDFGPEATIFAVLVCSVVTVYFLRKMTSLSSAEARELASA
jgi:membrane protease YdiL (CAAX protease family)